MTKIALIIEGLNSSDGAAAQADLRAFEIYRYPGIRALNCMTVNNTIGLHQVNASMAEL